VCDLGATWRFFDGWVVVGRLRGLVGGRLTSRGVDGVGMPETTGERVTWDAGNGDVVAMPWWVGRWGPFGKDDGEADGAEMGHGGQRWYRRWSHITPKGRPADLPFPGAIRDSRVSLRPACQPGLATTPKLTGGQ